MKIAIDTFGCDSKSGLGSYLHYFIANLPHSADLQFELFGFESDRYTYINDNGLTFTSVNLPDSEKKIRLWHKISFNKFARKNNYDVVLFPAAKNFLPEKYDGFQGVAVINGIVSYELKYAKKRKAKQLKHGLNKIKKIIATTNVIKEDLINNGIDGSKIVVIPNGIDHKVFYPTDDLLDDVVDVKPFAIKRPYFVYGSMLSTEEKKHIELIKAFELFKRNTGAPHRLVITGKDGAYSAQIRKVAYDSEFASDIIITGFFPHESIPKLYAGADVCAFPSTVEGFGMPVLEAMACGIPVICSDKGALKEVTGNNAIYFDSDNIEQIAISMQKIIENETLRKEKISEGLKWCQNYNWEKTVSLTIEYAITLS